VSFRPLIQSFVSANVPSPNHFQAVPDWSHDRLFVYEQGGSQQCARFVFSTGAEQGHANLAASGFINCMSLDRIGNIYVPLDLSNYTGVAQYTPGLELQGAFGVPSADPNYPNGINLPSLMTCVGTANANFLVAAGAEHTVDHGPILSLMFAGRQLGFGGHEFPTGSQSAVMCQGYQLADSANVFTLTGPILDDVLEEVHLYTTSMNQAAAAWPVADWPDAPNPFVFTVELGQIVPTDVDPSWTTIHLNGCVFDASDGQVVAILTCNDAVTNTAYIVKIDVADASIKWKIPVPHTTTDNSMMQMGRTLHGTFAYLSIGGITPHVHEVFIIDTADGTYTSYSDGLDGMTPLGGQCFDEISGAILCYGSYTEGADTPLPINDTPSSFTGWFAVYVTERYQPPVNVGGRTSHTAVRVYTGSA